MALVINCTAVIDCPACGTRLVFPARARYERGGRMEMTMSSALADPHLTAHQRAWPRGSKHDRLAYAKAAR